MNIPVLLCFCFWGFYCAIKGVKFIRMLLGSLALTVIAHFVFHLNHQNSVHVAIYSANVPHECRKGVGVGVQIRRAEGRENVETATVFAPSPFVPSVELSIDVTSRFP